MAYSGIVGQLVGMGDASVLLGESDSTTRRRAERGELPGMRLPSGQWLFEKNAVLHLRDQLATTPRRGRRRVATAS